MVIRAHAVFRAEQPVLAAVVAHIHDEIQIVAPDRALDNALAVAGGEPGALAGDDKGFLVHPHPLGPAHQMPVDLFAQLLGAGGHDQPQVGHAVLAVKEVLFRYCVNHESSPVLFFSSFFRAVPAAVHGAYFMFSLTYILQKKQCFCDDFRLQTAFSAPCRFLLAGVRTKCAFCTNQPDKVWSKQKRRPPEGSRLY